MYNSPGNTQQGEKIVHKITEVPVETPTVDLSMKKILIIFLSAIIVGVVGGYGAAFVLKSPASETKVTSAANTTTTTTTIDTDQAVPQKAGVDDATTFKDNAEGILQQGGIGGEGEYHLERPGGESQNVYLTSSTVDLSKYVGKKVKVKGQTYSAEKAGWLMDVGLIEVSQ